MGKKSLLLFIAAAVLVAASVSLFVVRQAYSRDYKVATYDEILSMPVTRAVYHSINNWQTVEDTEFEGVDLFSFLEEMGVEGDDAQVKLIAPDGYFWPAVDTVLTVPDLKKANANGLYPLLAWEMNGDILQPEPEGSGPLRLVMPQYREDHVNKPSWVSNVRLIEIGPVEGGSAPPDAAAVPVDEIWIYGDIPAVYPFPILLPLMLLMAGIAVLAGAFISRIGGKGRRGAPGPATLALLVIVVASLFVTASSLLAPPRYTCRANPGGRVFTMGELRSMPAFSGHYTFLKSQEPFTFYETDYGGVALSYLIEEKLNLAPGASGVRVIARDGYAVSLTLNQVRTVYSGGLKAIVAYERGGSALGGDEGSLRLIVPQSVPGNKEQGGDANTPLCARMVYAVEVQPLGAGEQVPAPGSVPEGSLVVYGAVSEPAPAPPQPAPQPPAPDGRPDQEWQEAGEQQQGDTGGENIPTPQSLLHDPSGAFSVSWLAASSLWLRPLEAVLPLAHFINSYAEGS